MPAWKQILDRIKSVKNTGKITRAMELISTVKMKKAADLALGARPFALEASNIFSRVTEEISMSPYVLSMSQEQQEKRGDKLLVVLITSNRGLCGAYNVNVFRQTLAHIAWKNAEFITIGKKAREFVVRTWNTLIADYSDIFHDAITASEVNSVSHALEDLFTSEHYREVQVIYSYYISAIAQKPIIRSFLPISTETLSVFLEQITGSVISPITYSGEYKIEPSKQHVADRIVPLVLDLMFHEMVLEAKASEHAARMVAMKNARESSATKAKELTLVYNKARQAGITKEISEIVSGVESMKDI